NWKASPAGNPINQANGYIMIPKMCSKDNHGVTQPKILSIKAAKATKAITLAAMIKIKRPAPKMESPKKEKNGSFLVASFVSSAFAEVAEPLIVAIVSSSAVTVTGFSIEVTIKALITLIGIAVKI